ncbi:MAG TPA: hypothetical protein VGN65_00570 [Casimicrobiaceae bacterium]
MTVGGRVDAHHHVWSLARGDYAWPTPSLAPIYRDFSLADMMPLARSAGIVKPAQLPALIAMRPLPTTAALARSVPSSEAFALDRLFHRRLPATVRRQLH